MGFVLPSWRVRVCVGCPVLALSWLVGCALRVVWACVFGCYRAGVEPESWSSWFGRGQVGPRWTRECWCFRVWV